MGMEARAHAHLSEEDRQRADIYSLIAALLARAPDDALLQTLSKLQGSGGSFGAAIDELAEKARTHSAADVAEEYQDLFIGLGRGELVPYASYYLTGFLNEKPLARLRSDLRALGIERDPKVKEPEDHMAVLLDVMSGLIRGEYGSASDERLISEQQARFFDEHLATWGLHFFAGLEKAKNARFYVPVGRLGRMFMEIEREALEME